MIGIIYKYTSPSGKCYIGQTINEKQRKQRHKRYSINGVVTKFYTAVRKYGWENFEYEVLFTIDNDDKKCVHDKLNEMEIYYIHKYDSFNNGYNMTPGGDGGGRHGHPMSEETKKRLSERMKSNNPAHNMTDEWRQHIGDSQRGKKRSDEFKQQRSEKMKQNNPMKNPDVAKKCGLSKIGKSLSEEHKQKISEANKGIIRSKEFKQQLSEIAKARPRDAKGHFIKNN